MSYGDQFPDYLIPFFTEKMQPLANSFSARAKAIREENKRAEASALLAPSLTTDHIGGLNYHLPNFAETLRDLIEVGIHRITDVMQVLINTNQIRDLQTYNNSYKPILTFVKKLARLPGSKDALFTNRGHTIMIDGDVVRFWNQSLNKSLDDEIKRNKGRGCLALKIKDDKGVSIFTSFFRIVFETIKQKLFAKRPLDER